MLISWGWISLAQLLLIGAVGFVIYKDIKETKKPGKKRKKMYVYGCLVLCAILLLAGLKLFASDAMSDLYHQLGGRAY